MFNELIKWREARAQKKAKKGFLGFVGAKKAEKIDPKNINVLDGYIYYPLETLNNCINYEAMTSDIE